MTGQAREGPVPGSKNTKVFPITRPGTRRLQADSGLCHSTARQTPQAVLLPPLCDGLGQLSCTHRHRAHLRSGSPRGAQAGCVLSSCGGRATKPGNLGRGSKETQPGEGGPQEVPAACAQRGCCRADLCISTFKARAAESKVVAPRPRIERAASKDTGLQQPRRPAAASSHPVPTRGSSGCGRCSHSTAVPDTLLLIRTHRQTEPSSSHMRASGDDAGQPGTP